MGNDAGSMSGTTSSFWLGDPGIEEPYVSWYGHTIALGGQWGGINGLYEKYPYTSVQVWFGFSGNGIVPGTHAVEGDITGIVAVYDALD